MSMPEIKDESVPVVIQMGICRNKQCVRFGRYGLLGDVCPGNTPYPLHNQIHHYKEIETFSERELCNLTDLSDFVGCCKMINVLLFVH